MSPTEDTRSLEERFDAEVAALKAAFTKRGHRLVGFAIVAVVDDGARVLTPSWSLERHESRAFDPEIRFALDEVSKLLDAE